jgi:glycosyltransferase involved in cell wall biosynthesis
MKIFVTGTRGVPDIPGGIEKHCQELYPRLITRGHKVFLATRKCYVEKMEKEWEGIKLIHLFAPRKKAFEAIVHTFLAVIKARLISPDVVHIHGIGPSLLVPFARMLGLKVVVTNHGPDYDRQKWGAFAKMSLMLGEKLGGIYANEVIVISNVIKEIIARRCKREANLIYNGVVLPPLINDKQDYLNTLNVLPKTYLLAVARFVPEKGLHDLISAFKMLDADIKLVIAGDADHETTYSRELRQSASEDPRIILTGYITGEPLAQVFSHARLFVLPSYHEGLPIALLEAMSYGLPVLVSDIPAHIEMGLNKERYFACGDMADLVKGLKKSLSSPVDDTDRVKTRKLVVEKYNWEKIADQTVSVYKKVITNHG